MTDFPQMEIMIPHLLCGMESLYLFSLPQSGTADAEIKVPSDEILELTNILPLKPGVGQNIAIHASPTARNIFLVQISTFPVHSPSFFPNPLILQEMRSLFSSPSLTSIINCHNLNHLLYADTQLLNSALPENTNQSLSIN